MTSTTKVYHSRKSDEWSTPLWLYDRFLNLFLFDLDVAATEDNALCFDYYTRDRDGLREDWTGKVCWMNPPYSQVSKWIEKAAFEAACTVALVPSRTDTKWFQNHILGTAHYFVPGRLKFGESKNAAPFPSLLVLFDNHPEISFQQKFELACGQIGKVQREKKRNSQARHSNFQADTSNGGSDTETTTEEKDISLSEAFDTAL